MYPIHASEDDNKNADAAYQYHMSADPLLNGLERWMKTVYTKRIPEVISQYIKLFVIIDNALEDSLTEPAVSSWYFELHFDSISVSCIDRIGHTCINGLGCII